MHQKSLSAINGGQSIDTTRALGRMKGVAVIILDSGGTDNFISPEVVSTLNLPVSNSIVLPVVWLAEIKSRVLVFAKTC